MNGLKLYEPITLHCRASKFKAVDKTDFCKHTGIFPSIFHWLQQETNTSEVHILSLIKTELNLLLLEIPA